MSDTLPDTKVPDTQEFFENQSQTNALNAKRTFDEFQDISLTAARRSQANFDSLQNVSLQAVQNAVTTQDIMAKMTVKSLQTGYALGDQNLGPETQETGQTLAAAGYPANRAVDVAAAGQAVNSVAATGASVADIFASVGTTLTSIQATLATMNAALAGLLSVSPAKTA